MVGLMASSSKRAYAIPKSAAPRAPVPVTVYCPRILPQEMLKQFCLSLCGVPGSWCTHGLFEPSERLWREWGLILNMNSPLLPSCWGFSFVLGRGVSLHGQSSKAQMDLNLLNMYVCECSQSNTFNFVIYII